MPRIKIDDKDFAILEPGEHVEVICKTRTGDEEKVRCDPVGRGAKMTLGSIVTQLGSPAAGNGILEVRGGDIITVEGTGFSLTNNSVRLDGFPVVISSQSRTRIVFTQPTTFGVTDGFAKLQVNNFDNNRVTIVPFWIKDALHLRMG